MYKGSLIFWAGQYAYIAKEIAEDMNCFSKIDFLDDNNPLAIGCIDDFETFTNEYDSAIVAIETHMVRLRLFSLLEDKYKIVTLIHPRAFFSNR